jgi:DNA (cytosine-5)-methyltransferase 1
LGWTAAFLSEIAKFPRAVLTHHYPAVPLHGDFTSIHAGKYDSIDLLLGGTP